MDCIAVIPARYASRRFPGKPLASLAGRPLIQHVVDRCRRIPGVAATVVATDDGAVARAAEAAGAEVVMTPSELASGTDRVAAAAQQYDAEVVVNVQADEVLLEPEALGGVLASFRADGHRLGTLRAPLRDPRDLWDPNVVKVVVDRAGRALYFSRAPLPFPRAQFLAGASRLEPGPRPAAGPQGAEDPGASDAVCLSFSGAPSLPGPYWVHVGVYLYRRSALERWAALPPSLLERLEGLEQLRALEAGEAFQTYLMAAATVAVNTPEDLERLRAAYAAGSLEGGPLECRPSTSS